MITLAPSEHIGHMVSTVESHRRAQSPHHRGVQHNPRSELAAVDKAEQVTGVLVTFWL